MKNILLSFLLFIIFIAILTGSVYGVILPKNPPVAIIGPMQISTSENGLSLFQDSRGQFYYVSPFNDGVTVNGKRSALITSEELSKHTFTSTYSLSGLKVFLETLENYFGIHSPSITFSAHNTAEYNTIISGNKLVVQRKISVQNGQKLQETDISLSYNVNDFVFDKTGKLYNYISEDALQTFIQTYSINLTPSLDELNVVTPAKVIYIYNPYMAATIAIQASPSQTIIIDRNNRIIHLEENAYLTGNTYTDSMNIFVFNTPNEAEKSL